MAWSKVFTSYCYDVAITQISGSIRPTDPLILTNYWFWNYWNIGVLTQYLVDAGVLESITLSGFFLQWKPNEHPGNQAKCRPYPLKGFIHRRLSSVGIKENREVATERLSTQYVRRWPGKNSTASRWRPTTAASRRRRSPKTQRWRWRRPCLRRTSTTTSRSRSSRGKTGGRRRSWRRWEKRERRPQKSTRKAETSIRIFRSTSSLARGTSGFNSLRLRIKGRRYVVLDLYFRV